MMSQCHGLSLLFEKIIERVHMAASQLAFISGTPRVVEQFPTAMSKFCHEAESGVAVPHSNHQILIGCFIS